MSLTQDSLGRKGRRRKRRAEIEKARSELFSQAERFLLLTQESGAESPSAGGRASDPRDPGAVARMIERHLEEVLAGRKRAFSPSSGATFSLLRASFLKRKLLPIGQSLSRLRFWKTRALPRLEVLRNGVQRQKSVLAKHVPWTAQSPALVDHPLIVLYRPEIPPNTGTIARLCAAFRMKLVLIGPIGFDLSEKAFRRAGLDYWPWVDLTVCESWDEFLEKWPERRLVFFETSGSLDIGDFVFGKRDALVFGPETSGVPASIMERAYPQGSSCLRIPMWQPAVRSINLANSVSIAATHALHGKSSRV